MSKRGEVPAEAIWRLGGGEPLEEGEVVVFYRVGGIVTRVARGTARTMSRHYGLRGTDELALVVALRSDKELFK